MRKFYGDADVDLARDILFSTSFPGTDGRQVPRKMKWRGMDKKREDVQEIVNIFLEMPPATVLGLNYVARDLSKLPPLSMNNFDMSSIISNIETLQLHVKILQESHEDTVSSISNTLSDRIDHAKPLVVKLPPVSTTVHKQSTVSENKTHHGGQLSSNSTPTLNVGVSTHRSIFSDGDGDDTTDDDDDNDDDSNKDNSQIHDNLDHSGNGDLLRLARIQGISSKDTMQRHQSKYSDVIRKGRPSSTNHKQYGSGAQGVNNPRRSSQYDNTVVIKGSGSNFRLRASRMNDTKKSPPRQPSELFVSRLAKSTKAAHLEKHIEYETGLRVTCEPLITKYDSYKSFHVLISNKDHKQLLVPALWPKGTIVRPYLE
jgi:hypothetical protein